MQERMWQMFLLAAVILVSIKTPAGLLARECLFVSC
jgi:hypothetical protein